MGCFLGCFGSSKDRRRKSRKQQQQHKKHNKVQPRFQRNAADQNLVPSIVPIGEQNRMPEKPVIISAVVEEEIQEEELVSAVLRKKVTFDSNVRTYEPVSVKASAEFLPPDKDEQKEDNDEYKLRKQDQSDASSEGSSVTSSSTSYPSNHRYQNCRDSDDELDMEDRSDSDSDSDSDEDDYENGELEYNNMYDDPSSRFAVYEEGFEGKPGRNVRERSGYVHPVLNPVENLSQWKAAKSKKSSSAVATPQLKPSDKENHEQEILEPSFKVKKPNKEDVGGIAVDASLSNWLSATSSVSSDCCSTPLNKQQPATTATLSPPERSYSGSPNSFEDRPILGALTLEEIRQMSASNSPMRKSPGGHSPDDMPIIGSVGSYWSESDSSSSKKELSSAASSSFKGIPNTTSKYREDKRVNWHTTPFETRLERALNNAGQVGGADDAF